MCFQRLYFFFVLIFRVRWLYFIIFKLSCIFVSLIHMTCLRFYVHDTYLSVPIASVYVVCNHYFVGILHSLHYFFFHFITIAHCIFAYTYVYKYTYKRTAFGSKCTRLFSRLFALSYDPKCSGQIRHIQKSTSDGYLHFHYIIHITLNLYYMIDSVVVRSSQNRNQRYF